MVEGRRPDIGFFEASRRYIEGTVQNCLPTMQGINILVISADSGIFGRTLESKFQTLLRG
jgi:hypothetical protein